MGNSLIQGNCNRSIELNHYQTTKNIFVAKSPASAGILEGLKHYKVIK